MSIEAADGDTPKVAQEMDASDEGGVLELSLETGEQADTRIAEMNRVAEEVKAADAAETQPKIEEVRRALGIPTEQQVEQPIELRMMSEAVEANARNLEQRMRGEITGIELDRRDAENEQILSGARAELLRKTGVTPSQTETPVSVPPSEVVRASATLAPEQETAVTQEKGSSMDRKLNQSELFVDRISAATDLRSLSRFLTELGDITAPDGYVYKNEDTLRTIGWLKDSKDPNLEKITNTHGLRDKVKKLLLLREI